jgi:hypothetical protein
MRLPWWLDLDRARSPAEGRAFQTIMAIFAPVGILAVFLAQWPARGLGVQGNNAFLLIVVIAIPPSLAIAGWLGRKMRPELFQEAEAAWRKRNGAGK